MGTFHWPLAPSFAPVWGFCSGAIMAAAQYPNLDTDETLEGNAAHWVVSETLVAHIQQGHAPNCDEILGVTAPNGVVVDEKIVQGAQVMVDEVLEVAGEDKANLFIEHAVKMPNIHPQNGGTLDAALYLPARRVLFLWDYKHGHRECLAKENLQMIDYMEGLADELGINGQLDQEITVVFRIVQPFCYRNDGPVDEWSVKLSDLRGYYNQLHAQAHEAFNNPQLRAGKHCRDCPAVGPCSASRRGGYEYIDLVNQPYEMDSMTGRDLVVERDILLGGKILVDARLKAIEDDLKHRISNGEADTGLRLEGKFGHLEWTVPKAQAIAMASQFGFDISTKSIRTPTQAKDDAPKEIKKQYAKVIESITKRPAKGLTLTRADDTIAARAFSKN